RATQIHEEYQQLRQMYDKWKIQDQQRIAAKQREDLLGTNSSNRSRNASQEGSSSQHSKPIQDATAILMMDGLLKENEVLTTSDGRLDEFITLGRSALQELYEQRTILKSTQKRMLDIATSLGLSTTVIRYIERRTKEDKWILWGGIIVSVILMYLILRYFGK
ncbi:Golgi SNAP receptor complex member 2, partial [Blyttiomyces sp. JEL0837]